MKLLASAPTLERLAVMASKHYYSTITIEGDKVFNLKGQIMHLTVKKKGSRYRLEEITQ